MLFRHVMGVALAASLIAIAGPAAMARAGTGTFTYHTVGGNEGALDGVEPYRCYELGDSDEPVMSGFNGTVFTAALYGDTRCDTEIGRVERNTGFDTDPVSSVQFYPPCASQEPAR
ncbi:hypothetical protein [Streptomyces sp. NBC_01803]|uniref:hypothetical protein n=1 Tax=Streptomyces sp. NBC_01803 TaxID=2975946 RepID=UPI002DDC19B5|nr:hypothetical protein [Streptomyces sp. NBC_01803]WSA46983.1 hypothetical protein OIE51_24075 [Streptomyces sp. NBC_01803]